MTIAVRADLAERLSMAQQQLAFCSGAAGLAFSSWVNRFNGTIVQSPADLLVQKRVPGADQNIR